MAEQTASAAGLRVSGPCSPPGLLAPRGRTVSWTARSGRSGLLHCFGALIVGAGPKTTLCRHLSDSINLQPTPILAAASAVLLLIVRIISDAMAQAQIRHGSKKGYPGWTHV